MSIILKEYKMNLSLLKEGEKIDLKKLGTRSKLGGLPNWEQNAEIPLCTKCDKEMVFVAQIDSMLSGNIFPVIS